VCFIRFNSRTVLLLKQKQLAHKENTNTLDCSSLKALTKGIEAQRRTLKNAL